MDPEYFVYILSIAALLLIVVKTYLFSKSTSKRKLGYWFFFNSKVIYNSRSEKTRKNKVLQNRLTLIIAAALAIDLGLILIFHAAQ